VRPIENRLLRGKAKNVVEHPEKKELPVLQKRVGGKEKRETIRQGDLAQRGKYLRRTDHRVRDRKSLNQKECGERNARKAPHGKKEGATGSSESVASQGSPGEKGPGHRENKRKAEAKRRTQKEIIFSGSSAETQTRVRFWGEERCVREKGGP